MVHIGGDMTYGGAHKHWLDIGAEAEAETWEAIHAAAEAGTVPSSLSPSADRLSKLAFVAGQASVDTHPPAAKVTDGSYALDAAPDHRTGPYWQSIDRSLLALHELSKFHQAGARLGMGALAVVGLAHERFAEGRARRLEADRQARLHEDMSNVYAALMDVPDDEPAAGIAIKAR